MEALGLTAAAAAVYQAMLDHPADGVDQLTQRCNLSPVQVHDCLDELGQLMLVRASSEHPGQMRAVSPEVGLAECPSRHRASARRVPTLAEKALERLFARSTSAPTVRLESLSQRKGCRGDEHR